ncbi:hypothetical protein PR048_006395 [Dryococelus australis]|uniref:Transposase n=1 Tax=Dryococelus australis TaxID=614101 RepID=A0ABQ9IAU9_9NEOP|nr:hypothetical protein PR048_006395 [Dryococelus australis]
MCTALHTNGENQTTNAPYHEAVGSLMYLSVGTRPDITFAVNSAGQYLENPKKIHWTATLCLVTFRFPEDHKALNISEKLDDIITTWKLEVEVFSVVTDNAANTTAGMQLIQSGCLGVQHLPCAAHTLNLVIHEALSRGRWVTSAAQQLKAVSKNIPCVQVL